MRHLSRAALAVAAVMLIGVGACHTRPAANAVTAPTTLTSTNAELPADDAHFPAGPHADAINLHCTACHSVSMVLTQPPLSADQWKAEVTKMREAYKAPVPDAAVSDILAYLEAMSAAQVKAHGPSR